MHGIGGATFLWPGAPVGQSGQRGRLNFFVERSSAGHLTACSEPHSTGGHRASSPLHRSLDAWNRQLSSFARLSRWQPGPSIPPSPAAVPQPPTGASSCAWQGFWVPDKLCKAPRKPGRVALCSLQFGWLSGRGPCTATACCCFHLLSLCIWMWNPCGAGSDLASPNRAHPRSPSAATRTCRRPQVAPICQPLPSHACRRRTHANPGLRRAPAQAR